MGFSVAVLGLTLSTTLASSGHSASCTPAKLGANVASQPEAWRQAAAALVESTATPGLPWSCGGGEVDVVAHDDGATLTVTTADGRVITRKVSWPDEVQPLGEALLARPMLPPPEVAAVPPPEPAPTPATPPGPPRVLIDGTIGPRYAGGSGVLWGSLGVAAALPFGPWGGGLWFRYDGIPKRLEPMSPRLRAINVGGTAFRNFDLGPLSLRTALRPSLAVVTRPEERERDETRFDFRVGPEVSAIIPITRHLRAVIALDGDLSPAELGRRRPPPQFDHDSQFPKYTLGLSIGLEAAIR